MYAIASGVQGSEGVGKIKHNLEIMTETEQLVLPIAASVITAAQYDEQCAKGSPNTKQAPGVRYVSDVPMPVQGVTGLRKTLKGL